MDRKAATKQKIRDAFWAAYAKKPIEKVTVREITDLVGINRVTFYAHYPDIYAIREEMENEILRWARVHLNVQRKRALRLTEAGVRETMLEMEGILSQYRPYVNIIFGPHGDLQFEERLKQVILSEYLDEETALSEEQEYVVEYVLSTQLHLFLHWMFRGKQTPLEELSALCYRLIAHGVGGYIQTEDGASRRF